LFLANLCSIYKWTIVDNIIDTHVDLGMKQSVEIGFMPKALSSNPQPYRFYLINILFL